MNPSSSSSRVQPAPSDRAQVYGMWSDTQTGPKCVRSPKKPYQPPRRLAAQPVWALYRKFPQRLLSQMHNKSLIHLRREEATMRGLRGASGLTNPPFASAASAPPERKDRSDKIPSSIPPVGRDDPAARPQPSINTGHTVQGECDPIQTPSAHTRDGVSPRGQQRRLTFDPAAHGKYLGTTNNRCLRALATAVIRRSTISTRGKLPKLTIRTITSSAWIRQSENITIA